MQSCVVQVFRQVEAKWRSRSLVAESQAAVGNAVVCKRGKGSGLQARKRQRLPGLGVGELVMQGLAWPVPLRGWLARAAVAVFGRKCGVCLEAAVMFLQPNPALKRTVNGGAYWLASSISAAPLSAA
jgi:hypothetical protein